MVGFETLKICVGYELDGETLDYLPTAADQQARRKPIYEEIAGWSESTEGARSWADLPAQAIKYERRIEELLRVFPKMAFVRVGDSGEADPVIYSDLQRKHPSRIAGVEIRKASDKALPEGLSPAAFVEDYRGQPNVLSGLVEGALGPQEAMQP